MEFNRWTPEEAVRHLASSLREGACRVLYPQPLNAEGRERNFTLWACAETSPKVWAWWPCRELFIHVETASATQRREFAWACWQHPETYGAFRLLSLCIGRHLPTVVFCVATHVTRTNIRNAQSCCERLASADIDRCSAMKSEWTITIQAYPKAPHDFLERLCITHLKMQWATPSLGRQSTEHIPKPWMRLLRRPLIKKVGWR